MRIVYTKSSGRGCYCSVKGRRTTTKRGGYVPLLLTKPVSNEDSVVRGFGAAVPTAPPPNKTEMNNVIRRLERMSVAPKRKNITFTF